MDGQQYATFVVELLLDKHGDVRRTRIVHVQTAAEERWAGWDKEHLLHFIMTHGDLSHPQ